MIYGQPLMPEWFADSWATQALVSTITCILLPGKKLMLLR